MENNYENRLTKIEIKIENIAEKISDLCTLKDAVVRLVIIQERQEENNKQNAETHDKLLQSHEKLMLSNVELSNTLCNINNNLTIMNDEVRGTGEKVVNIEKKFDGKLCEVEDKLTALDNKSKIDLIEVLKDITKAWVPKIAVGGIIVYLLQLIQNTIR